MKKLILISICFLCGIQLFSQQKKYIEHTTEQDTTFTKAIDSLLNGYFLLSNFKNKDGEIDLQKKKQFKTLFDEKAYVVDDLSISPANNSILLNDYADMVSLKLSKTKKQLIKHPYKRQILLDSILYDQYEDKYEIPLKLNKIVYYGLDSDSKVIENERSLNLLMYISYSNKTKLAKIAGIEEYKTNITWLDCNGEKNGLAHISNPCDDNDRSTINDAFQIDCTCKGTDCLGVINGIAKIGTPCDDGDDNTINDIYKNNCDCVGTVQCVVNTPCDDGNKNTYNDKFQKNCSCKGNCIIDGKPIKFGSRCNDNNKNTYNDVWQENCVCAGTDCVGEVDGLKIIGTKCDDGNDKTVNDVRQNNCECAGVPGCIENGDTIIIGAPCNDGFDITVNDVYQPDCTCKGEDCEGKVGGTALKGKKCNDGNPNTINDRYLDDCTCRGTIKTMSIYTGLGGLGYMPLNNSGSTTDNNGFDLSNENSIGGKFGILINPKSSKFYINAGVAYIPLKLKSSATLQHLQFENPGKDNSGIPVDKLYVNLSDLEETANSNYLQIPLGISYEITNSKKVKILIDVLAKPYVQITDPGYSLKTSVQYAGEYSQYDAGENSQLDIPIILKAKNFDLPGANEDEYYNEFHTVMKENRYEKAFEFMQDTSEESLNLGSPFAVAGGVNFLASVGNSGAVSLYMHYNYYFSNINWAAAYNENDIEEFLIAGNKKLSGSEDFNIETNNFKSTISSSSSFISQGLEAGLSYYVKIK